MTFSLSSSAFDEGAPIPTRYSGEGDDVSPALAWSDPPPGTKSFALIVEDPDAPSGTFRHWGIYNIGGDVRSLPEAASRGFIGVANDFGDRNYRGPHPPRGHGVHHYHFRLAALDVDTLSLAPSAKVAELWRAVAPHLVAEASLVGTYQR